MSLPDISVKLCDANQSFLCSLYSCILKEKPNDNIFFSPFSISVALSMTLAGARDNTETQMKKTLGFEQLDDTQLHSSYKKLLDDVTGSASGSPAGMVSVANGLFVQNHFQLLQPFVETIQKMYNGVSKSVDFAGNKQEALSLINGWVKSMTRDKIPQLLDDVDPLTALVIINAVYFKGLWTYKFDPSKTKTSDFYINESNVVQANMMELSKELRHTSSETADCDIVEFPYEDGKTSMVVFLPRERSGLPKIEAQLSPQFIKDCISGLEWPWPFRVKLPRFKLEDSYSLGPMLKGMGMADLFEPRACNLTGISEKSDLYVSEVIHKSVVEVNEEGTEAAAATAVKIMLRCYKHPREFVVDHPFLFCIVDKTSQSIYFIGRLKKP